MMTLLPEPEATPRASTNPLQAVSGLGSCSSSASQPARDCSTTGTAPQPTGGHDAESSPYYSILPTPYGGRGAFARAPIPRGTVILKCEGPYAGVVLRKFRKEVCAWCFAWCYESASAEGGKRKGSWNVRLDGVGGGEGAGGKKKGKEKVWTAYFCGEPCRTSWVGDYSWGSRGEGKGTTTDELVEVMSTFEKTLTTYRNARARSKSTSSSNSSTTKNTTLAHPLTFLDSWASKAQWDAVTEESVDWWWALAADATGAKNMDQLKPRKILDILEGWNEKSGQDTDGELLTEFEADCARFVLDGLVRRACEERRGAAPSSHSPSTVGSAPDEVVVQGAGEDEELDGPTSIRNAKPTGTWPDLLNLQNNELEHLKRRPYMLAVFVRVFLFLKYVVLAARPPAPRRGARPNRVPPSPSEAGTGMQGEPPATANGADDDDDAGTLYDALAKILEDASSVRAILARDHGNVFGIWERGAARIEDIGRPLEDEERGGEDGEMFGWGMYVFGSYFNHDCTPSVRKMQHGRALYFATTRDVQAGEELCISYIDVSKGNPVEKRNEELKREWFFECGCARCVRERGEGGADG